MLNEFFAGGIGGAVSVVVGQPFDTIKVRLQTSAKYKGIVDCFTKIVAEDGISGLFRGTIPPLVTAAVQNAVVFAANDAALKYIRRNSNGSSDRYQYSHLMLSGGFAGLLSAFIQCPTELVKIRLQLHSRSAYSSTMDCVQQIYRTSGVVGLFRGLPTTVVREIPAFSSYFASHKMAENYLNSWNLNPFVSSFIAGGVAGAISWAVVYPVDLVKTEIQMNSYDSTPDSKRLVKRTWSYYSEILPVNAVLFPTHKFCSELFSTTFDAKRMEEL